jgi:hypothetical protein
MFKNWKWQQWVGKFLLLAVALVELLIKELGVAIPWSAIILPAVVWIGQFLWALTGKEAWQWIVGKLLLFAIGIIELILAALGVNVPFWTVMVPLITAFAQYLISLIPIPTP